MPDGFWGADIVSDALASWHMGRVIRAYRHHPWHGARPLPQEIVAGWLNVTQTQLSRIESGAPPRDLDKLVKWAQTLSIPEPLLWFKLPTERSSNDLSVPRAVTSAARFENPARSRMPSNVNGHALTEFEGDSDVSVMQAFRLADRQIGGGHLYPTVVSYLQTTVAPRLFGGTDDDRTLFTAASALTEMAGWMAHDAGQSLAAQQHFGRSLDLATIGGDFHLRAHIYASMSHLSIHAGKPSAAIDLARQGQQLLASGPPNPGLSARLLAMEARSLATLQQQKECSKALLHAEKALEKAASYTGSPWVSHFDEGSLASEAARCMRQVGALGEAEAQARQIISLRPSAHTRSRAFGQLLLITVLIAQDRPDEACSVGREVLDATESLSSYLVIEQLREVQDLLKPYRASRVVAEFLRRLHDVLRERVLLYRRLSADGFS
ncbi:hypothetical protein J4573_16620 [Actinomadura barringtoniae]|uniref:XRE family transcriptional regulator n=1 Tax=Actinomadura barringtoniae TaxID=1427535 RepID=A0A939PEM9_9ACTN|nr:hypothetical protein [Actinomadura barringtoniae]MBO2448728.1 hypothetical protein [Actinomadura barringtoniae]